MMISDDKYGSINFLVSGVLENVLESKSSDLDVFELGGSATATFPKSYDLDSSAFPNLQIWTQQIQLLYQQISVFNRFGKLPHPFPKSNHYSRLE
jgi:hypothetical protein